MRFEQAAADWNMRVRHFLGQGESRNPKVAFTGEQKTAKRKKLVTSEPARRLHQNATKDLCTLADLMPALYFQNTGDVSF